MEDLKVVAADETKTLTVLEGRAVVQQNPDMVVIGNGSINAPSAFLQKKIYEASTAHVTVDYERAIVNLVLNEKDSNGLCDKITGQLEPNLLIKKMKINTNERMSKDELVDLVRFNRAYFKNQITAGSIITQLRKFVAKIEKRIEMTDDQRGNTKKNLESAVSEMELPSSFNLEMPIWRGIREKTEFSVEICVDVSSSSINFYLISDDLFVLEVEQKEQIIKEEIERIQNRIECSVVETFCI